MKTKLINAQEMAKENPVTFHAPRISQLITTLKKDWFVKVSPGQERFWCCIVMMDKTKIIGRVDNDLLFTNDHGYKMGDLVEIQYEEIYDFTSPI